MDNINLYEEIDIITGDIDSYKNTAKSTQNKHTNDQSNNKYDAEPPIYLEPISVHYENMKVLAQVDDLRGKRRSISCFSGGIILLGLAAAALYFIVLHVYDQDDVTSNFHNTVASNSAVLYTDVKDDTTEAFKRNITVYNEITTDLSLNAEYILVSKNGSDFKSTALGSNIKPHKFAYSSWIYNQPITSSIINKGIQLKKSAILRIGDKNLRDPNIGFQNRVELLLQIHEKICMVAAQHLYISNLEWQSLDFLFLGKIGVTTGLAYFHPLKVILISTSQTLRSYAHNGLLQYCEEIGSDSFSGISVYDNKLYSLYSNPCRVKTYRHVLSRWQTDGTMSCGEVNYNNIVAYGVHFYMTSRQKNSIYIYNHNGSLLSSISSNSNKLHLLENPLHLCGMDADGNIYIADMYDMFKMRLQIYDMEMNIVKRQSFSEDYDVRFCTYNHSNKTMWVIIGDLVKMFLVN